MAPSKGDKTDEPCRHLVCMRKSMAGVGLPLVFDVRRLR